MRATLSTATSRLEFEALGRTLELYDGDRVRVALGFVVDDSSAPFGGADGTLTLYTAGRAAREASALRGGTPEGTVDEGERAYLLTVGDLHLAISSADYTGGGYADGVLTVQAGPLLLRFTMGGTTHGA